MELPQAGNELYLSPVSWTRLGCPSSHAEMEIPLITIHTISNDPTSEVFKWADPSLTGQLEGLNAWACHSYSRIAPMMELEHIGCSSVLQHCSAVSQRNRSG